METSSLVHLQQLYSEQMMYNLLNATNHLNRLWHVAVPKTGSSWLSKIMTEIYRNKKLSYGFLVPAHGSRFQEIDPRLMFQYGIIQTGSCFYQHQHCEYSEYTYKLMAASNMKCIFQMRDIFDVAISLYDHLIKNRETGFIEDQQSKHLKSLSEEQIMEYAIGHRMPWAIQLAANWLNAPIINDPNKVLVVDYESLLNEPFEVVKKVVAFSGLDVSDTEINHALEAASSSFTRKNKAVTGRGKQLLSDKHIEALSNMAKLSGLKQFC